ncbi:uncharacterized protein LOC119322788 isoform X1 [Triticum dicoccoides]|uniref:uncharacterized protein LOC119322788 isoform X1 n=1 Tax=Triticum dicoccoides TaxID=85692 RepID=UPI001890F57A|nr:uncharacterized protein LOC119322788 isoform X1 [Triticum dicoccoides]
MRKTKGGDDDGTRRSQKSRRACNSKGDGTKSLDSLLVKVRGGCRVLEHLLGRIHRSRRVCKKKTNSLTSAWVKMWEIRRSFDDLTERLQESRVHNGEEEETKSLASVWGKAWKIRRAVHDLTEILHDCMVRNGEEEETKSLASVWERVRKIMRAVDDLTLSLHKSRVLNGKEEVTNSLASVHKKKLHPDLVSMGYPEPPKLDGSMILVNTFEETFGDTYPKGDWREFSEKASSKISCYVVALASFSGGKRHFACSGFFIEWNGSTVILTSASLVRSSSDENKIDRNLEIKVLLPKGRLIDGTLKHYSLHYNVALVSFKDCRVVCPAIIQRRRYVCSKIAAVGRCFNSGTLMAKIGEEVTWTGTLDCVCIERISCKISKAGIGGPLVNLDGEVVGMDFYDPRIGTPIVMWDHVEHILQHIEKSDPSGAAFWKMAGDPSKRLNRWPVPAPCWRSREDVEKDKKSEEDEMNLEPPPLPPRESFSWVFNFFQQKPGSEPSSSHINRSNPFIYGFIDGKKVLLSI